MSCLICKDASDVNDISENTGKNLKAIIRSGNKGKEGDREGEKEGEKEENSSSLNKSSL